MEAIVMNEFESNWTLDHPLEGLRSSMVTVFFVRFFLDGRIISDVLISISLISIIFIDFKS